MWASFDLRARILHIHYDEPCSWDPQYERYLEQMAKIDKQKRKARMSKRKGKRKKEDESFIRLVEFVSRLKSRRFRD